MTTSHPRPVRNLGLVLRPERELGPVLDHVGGWAVSHDISLIGLAGESRLPASVELCSEVELGRRCDVVLALGGDGTMLSALRLTAPDHVPVLGVNLGTLGYLTELDVSHLDDGLAALQSGDFEIESRTAVEVRRAGSEPPVEIAYNDAVLSRVPGRGLAKLGLRVDGELLVRYSSDGVIVATSQGSTGYSFAAGGPLLSPRARGLVITPDAPHGLFNRAVVLAEQEQVEVEVLLGSAPVALEIDGQLADTLQPGTTLALRALPTAAHVVRVRPGGFADQARRKLGIVDPANLADFDPAGHTYR